LDVPVSRRVALLAFGLFAALLLWSLLAGAPPQGGVLPVAAAFYRSGALVFGGGHVVLPLLRQAFVTPGWISDDAFLAGYGAAQSIPGPLFTFCAYLGWMIRVSPQGPAGAGLGLLAVFVPGLLLLVATLPVWSAVRGTQSARAAIQGVNAAVTGLLAAALYQPVISTSIRSIADAVLAVLGFALLVVWRVAPLYVVLMTAAGAVLLQGHVA
jgi:chromate transporter